MSISSSSKSSSWRRAVLAAVVLALGASCLLLANWTTTPPSNPIIPKVPSPRAPLSLESRRSVDQNTSPSIPPPEAAPGLATVTVDRDEICVGEQNVLRVHAHKNNKVSDIFINGEPSKFFVTTPTFPAESGLAPAVSILVDRRMQPVHVPPFKVKSCNAALSGDVQHSLVSGSSGAYLFSATVRKRREEDRKSVV